MLLEIKAFKREITIIISALVIANLLQLFITKYLEGGVVMFQAMFTPSEMYIIALHVLFGVLFGILISAFFVGYNIVKIREGTHLKEHAENLERRVEKGEAEMKALKELDRLKDELISNVSHELRTPLTIAKSAIEIAGREEEGEEVRRVLGVGREALIRQDFIIGNLVEIAEFQKGDFRIKPEPLDMGHLLKLAVKTIEPVAKKKNIKLELSVSEEVSPVWGDFRALQKVVLNLLDNAFKFNKEGGRVIVEAKGAENFVEVSVADTGVGIPKELYEKIFERFYQVDGSLTRRYGGTGMGLAVAKEIVKAHGGDIKVESELGRGSKFTFKVPVKG